MGNALSDAIAGASQHFGPEAGDPESNDGSNSNSASEPPALVSASSLVALTASAQVTRLTLGSQFKIRWDSSKHRREVLEAVSSLSQRCPALVELVLDGAALPDRGKGASAEQIIPEELMDAVLDALPELTRIELRSLSLEAVPAVFFESDKACARLRSLTLRDNAGSLQSLPISLFERCQLHVLDISGNSLTNIPGLKHRVPTMQSLNLSRNRLSELSTSILAFSALTCLDVSHNALTEIPKILSKLGALRILRASHNQLANLTLRSMRSLRILDVSNNKLTTLPPADVWRGMKSLTTLSLQHNQLQTVDACFAAGDSLLELWINDNLISVLGGGIAGLRQLRSLHAHENSLEILPVEIGALRSLRTLQLEFNALSKLPKSMNRLLMLVKLSLQFNQFKVIPEVLREMPSLLRLSLEGNPLNEADIQAIRSNGAAAYVHGSSMPTHSHDDLTLQTPSFGVFGTVRHVRSVSTSERPQLADGLSAPKPSSSVPASSHKAFGSTTGRSLTSSVRRLRAVSLAGDLEHGSSRLLLQSPSTGVSVPKLDKFKVAFDHYLGDSDLSDSAQANMKRLSTAAKFHLLRANIGSTADLLATVGSSVKSSGFGTVKGKASVRQFFEDDRQNKRLADMTGAEFVAVLRGARGPVSAAAMFALAQRLDTGMLVAKSSVSSPAVFLASFLQDGGVVALSDVLLSVGGGMVDRGSEPLSKSDSLLERNGLRCVNLLTEVSLRSVVAHPACLEAAGLGLISLDVQSRLFATKILCEFALIPTSGPYFVMSALLCIQEARHVPEIAELRTLAASRSRKPPVYDIPDRTKHRARLNALIALWSPLMDVLRDAAGCTDPVSMAHDSVREELAMAAMELINTVISNLDDFLLRFDTRVAVLSVGLLDLITHFRKNASQTMLATLLADSFASMHSSDEDDFIDAAGAIALWSRKALSGSLSRGNVCRIASVIGSDSFDDKTDAAVERQNIIVPFEPEDPVGLIVQQACEQARLQHEPASSFSRFELRAFSIGVDDVPEFSLLDPEKTMAFYNLSGEVFAELRPATWDICFRVQHAADAFVDIQMEVDPSLPCTTICATVLKSAPISTSLDATGEIDYAIFACVDPESGDALKRVQFKDTRLLFSYRTEVDSVLAGSDATLERKHRLDIRPTPVAVDIVFPDEGKCRLFVDVAESLLDVKKKALQELVLHQKAVSTRRKRKNEQTHNRMQLVLDSLGRWSLFGPRGKGLSRSDDMYERDQPAVIEDDMTILSALATQYIIRRKGKVLLRLDRCPAEFTITLCLESSTDIDNDSSITLRSTLSFHKPVRDLIAEVLSLARDSGHAEIPGETSAQCEMFYLADTESLEDSASVSVPLGESLVLSAPTKAPVTQVSMMLDDDLPLRVQSIVAHTHLFIRRRLDMDTNIWEETSTADTIVCDDAGEVVRATLNQIILHIVSSPRSHAQDAISFFVGAGCCHVESRQMLRKLKEVYFHEKAVPQIGDPPKLRKRVVKCLALWLSCGSIDLAAECKEKWAREHQKKTSARVDEQPWMAEEAAIRKEFKQFFQVHVAADFPEESSVFVDRLEAGIDRWNKDKCRIASSPRPRVKLPRTVTGRTVLLDIAPDELARQLTLQCSLLFTSLSPSELVGTPWTKPRDIARQRAPRLTKLMDHASMLSAFVITEILRPERVRDRAKHLEYFIHVADGLLALRNFFSLNAITASLQATPVERLKWTFDKLSRRSRQLLETVLSAMSIDQHFRNYREALKSLRRTTTRGDLDGEVDKESEPVPVIPFLFLSINELQALDEALPSRIDRCLNFHKIRVTHKIIRQLLSFQDIQYNIAPATEVQEFVQSTKLFDENTQFEVSLKREPRGAGRSDIS